MRPCLIRPETAADLDAIRRMNRAAFGQDAEARLIDALRDGGHARLSLVAELQGQLIGHILFSAISIVSAHRHVPALALAPMAVLQEHQRRGIGSALVRRGLDDSRNLGYTIVIVLGHPRFYPRFGFSSTLAARLHAPWSGDAFMAAELIPGALNGVLGRAEYPHPFTQV
jgi:putative acetyltransferase